ncbi:MAG: alpha-amylase family glycosyl hydrolase, partial [Elusimicrobia bacterium]|nr:alpha-amylase family glycosyl hydrolase [Elusimicrobiota bacterium]
YLDDLLAPVPWADDARRKTRALLQSGDGAACYERLLAFVHVYVEELRGRIDAADLSRWVRRARIYEIFPRAFNLPGRRAALGRPAGARRPFFADFSTQDILDIKAMGFDALWPMGIFPIGRRGRTGSGGGSPYSIRDHERINPELGSEEDFRGFVERAHRADMRVIVDFVPNHTSLDSELLAAHPDFFMRKPASGGDCFPVAASPAGEPLWIRHGGYGIFGGVDSWIDTAQLDYSSPDLRRRMTSIASGWVERFGVDGFRVDMAYLDLNANFSRTWGVRTPESEFMEELITTVKCAHPATAFIAESYDNWDELSAAGFDLIYGKNNMRRAGGHEGWYDALQSRSPGWIRAALERAEFLRWQKGGADRLDFIGNHDEPSPRRAFGPWMKGAAFLTLMLPGSELFYGSQEVGFDRPDAREPKSIPFCAPVEVDWQGADPDAARFFQEAFAAAAAVRRRLGEPLLRVLRPEGETPWVGLRLADPQGRGRDALVFANPTDRPAAVDFRDPESGLAWRGELPACGYVLVGF